MKPVLQALLLADRVYEDRTGKKIIAGTFNKLIIQKEGAKPRDVEVDGVKRLMVPGGTQAGSPYVYISLTDLRGLAQCVLRYVDLSNDVPLFQMELAIRCDDPLQTVEIVLPMPPLPTHPGVHALELLCDDEPLGQFRVLVEELPPHKELEDDN